MTNREKYEQFLQSQVDLIKGLSDDDLSISAIFYDYLCVFVSLSGVPCKCVSMGGLIPDGQTERIRAWLKEEAKD